MYYLLFKELTRFYSFFQQTAVPPGSTIINKFSLLMSHFQLFSMNHFPISCSIWIQIPIDVFLRLMRVNQ